MYCMPQKGTKTSLYIGNGDEAQGIATGCIRTNGSTCEGTRSPEKKSFRSEHGKGMDLYPQRMEFNGGEIGKITFEDETGTTIESNGGLVLMAKEGIRLESMTGIAMQGMSDIMALYAEGASSLCVNGSVDMLGRLAGISASKYTGYPPYDDAPKEGEFDWDGFTRNLAIGLGVVAVCAIGAAISIATLGIGSILAGAFIGAGIGALSTTAIKVGEEISTGNVRSAKEAFRDVGISAASGFITGAFGAKFPGAHRLVEGVVDTVVSAGERYLYAVFDDSMSREEKWAYALDPGQMVADFVTGVVIGEILDGIMAAIQNKLRSIFANYDATMCEALESGSKSISQVDRIKIDAWDYTPDDELYLKYKDVFDNPKYYNQETGAINWPENNGFADMPMDKVLQPGARIDRYGSDYGSFTSLEGTPYEMRAVAPGTDQRPYSVFEVVEPINVKSGSIASWFDEPGGGIQ
ncbi:glycohydrolase toxin TNT-related protein [Roseburia inulinivorans]